LIENTLKPDFDDVITKLGSGCEPTAPELESKLGQERTDMIVAIAGKENGKEVEEKRRNEGGESPLFVVNTPSTGSRKSPSSVLEAGRLFRLAERPVNCRMHRYQHNK
jgi:hypothetical protein